MVFNVVYVCCGRLREPACQNQRNPWFRHDIIVRKMGIQPVQFLRVLFNKWKPTNMISNYKKKSAKII